MKVTINGEIEQLENNTLNLTKLLELKNVESPDMVSVQVNGEIIDRSHYDEKRIQEGDEIDFLYFMGGGA